MSTEEIKTLATRLLALVGAASQQAPENPLVTGVIRHVYHDHCFVRLEGGACRDNYYCPLSVVEGATDADLYPGRRVRFAAGLDDTGRLRVSRLILY